MNEPQSVHFQWSKIKVMAYLFRLLQRQLQLDPRRCIVLHDQQNAARDEQRVNDQDRSARHLYHLLDALIEKLDSRPKEGSILDRRRCNNG
jgi:hypothetical protein